jgi:hypothetical protein
MFGVTAGGPGLVAVGWMDDSVDDVDAAVWTSVDGITWTRVPHDEAVFGGALNQHMTDVTVGGPGLVVVGDEGNGAIDHSGDQVPAVWTSVDGFKWSRVPPETMPTGEASNSMVSVTTGGPGLVAVGRGWPPNNAAVWTSADGLTWSRIPHDEEVFRGIMLDVTVGGPGLVAVGESVWTSVDGITWSRSPDPEADSEYRWGVTVGGPGLVAVGRLGESRQDIVPL